MLVQHVLRLQTLIQEDYESKCTILFLKIAVIWREGRNFTVKKNKIKKVPFYTTIFRLLFFISDCRRAALKDYLFKTLHKA